MAEEKDAPLFGGFEALTGALLPGEGAPVDPEDEPELTEEELKAKLKEGDDEDEEDDDKKGGNEDDDGDNEEEDEGDNEDDSEDSDTENEREVEDISEAEPEIASFVAEQLADELGWQFGDEEKFESVKDIVDYMASVVEESSKPQYANEEVEKFDEFVRNGGSLREFYNSAVSGRVDVDNIDITVAENQRAVIREHLRNRGYKDDRINRTIDRFEDAEILDSEAEEALELLKEYNDAQEEKLLADQEKLAQQYKEQQQKFVTDVEQNIKSIKDIRGIKISEKQKKELLEYIFKPTQSGQTQYQVDYASSVNNLIESAFLTKEGETVFKEVEKKAKSDAYKDLHKKLKVNKGKNKSSQQDEEGASASLSILGNQIFRKPS